MVCSQATAMSSGAVTPSLDGVSGCGTVRSDPSSPGAGSEAEWPSVVGMSAKTVLDSLEQRE